MKILGVFRVKNHDFTPKNHILSNFRGARAGCAPTWLWFLVSVRIFFRTTQELEHLFFFPEFNIMLYDKNSELDFFFPPPKSEYFFRQHWESEYFFRKKPYPPAPFKLNGRSLNQFIRKTGQ